MTQVALLWHMHQPFYEDLVTREHILPWVRLHALKDYLGMVALLREFPQVRVTFNLVPSLLVQLEAFADDRARDRYLEVGLKPAAELTDTDAAFMVEHFFHAHRERMIDAHPRYAELLARRGAAPPPPGEARAVARRFSTDDLRDLQVWQKLAWIDPDWLATHPALRGLVDKGRGFSEDDKQALRAIELDLLNAVIPEYRAAAARGQIEIAASPFYHPILPLLCDSDVYLRTHPQSRMPRERFQHPEDAADQLERAAAYHERLFGRRPVGLWPSEGSVSDQMAPLAAAAGFRWMATDELILARTLDVALTRDADGHLLEPERLYSPYRLRVAGDGIACAFRDHALSDLIGFTYAGWPADAAADDFVTRLAEAGRRYAARTGGGEAFIPVILDGENAWEYYEGGGRPFLRALYARLAAHPELTTVTMAEGCGRPGAPVLERIFPGSWIDANFYIWIGHPDDQRAWGQLADARAALDEPSAVPAAARAQAREEVLIAEGSDWFWWYGDDHSSAHDQEFDDLFRRHLRNAYRLLQRPIPDELFISNITTTAAAPAQSEPTSLLSPTLDGEETSYFEWLGAGLFEVRDAAGAMHQIDRPPSLLTGIRFGFDAARLLVRVDARRRMLDLLADGYELSLKFVTPAGVRFSVLERDGRLTGAFWDRPANAPAWMERGPDDVAFAAATVLEAALPLADLGAAPGDRLAFFVAVYDASGEVERHPESRPIETEVPAADFAGRHWTA
jgi:alpha-amylase/alpha-mannosidase (GH57 family)